jgi:hypothetical protein
VLELKLGDGRKRSRRLRKKWKVEIRKAKGENEAGGFGLLVISYQLMGRQEPEAWSLELGDRRSELAAGN